MGVTRLFGTDASVTAEIAPLDICRAYGDAPAVLLPTTFGSSLTLYRALRLCKSDTEMWDVSQIKVNDDSGVITCDLNSQTGIYMYDVAFSSFIEQYFGFSSAPTYNPSFFEQNGLTNAEVEAMLPADFYYTLCTQALTQSLELLDGNPPYSCTKTDAIRPSLTASLSIAFANTQTIFTLLVMLGVFLLDYLNKSKNNEAQGGQKRLQIDIQNDVPSTPKNTTPMSLLPTKKAEL